MQVTWREDKYYQVMKDATNVKLFGKVPNDLTSKLICSSYVNYLKIFQREMFLFLTFESKEKCKDELREICWKSFWLAEIFNQWETRFLYLFFKKQQEVKTSQNEIAISGY